MVHSAGFERGNAPNVTNQVHPIESPQQTPTHPKRQVSHGFAETFKVPDLELG
jgi:hypothetical protein